MEYLLNAFNDTCAFQDFFILIQFVDAPTGVDKNRTFPACRVESAVLCIRYSWRGERILGSRGHNSDLVECTTILDQGVCLANPGGVPRRLYSHSLHSTPVASRPSTYDVPPRNERLVGSKPTLYLRRGRSYWHEDLPSAGVLGALVLSAPYTVAINTSINKNGYYFFLHSTKNPSAKRRHFCVCNNSNNNELRTRRPGNRLWSVRRATRAIFIFHHFTIQPNLSYFFQIKISFSCKLIIKPNFEISSSIKSWPRGPQTKDRSFQFSLLSVKLIQMIWL